MALSRIATVVTMVMVILVIFDFGNTIFAHY